MVAPLQAALRETVPTLEVLDNYRLAYSREVLAYERVFAKNESGVRYETDLLVVERIGKAWTHVL
jgi:hypothetical protein